MRKSHSLKGRGVGDFGCGFSAVGISEAQGLGSSQAEIVKESSTSFACVVASIPQGDSARLDSDIFRSWKSGLCVVSATCNAGLAYSWGAAALWRVNFLVAATGLLSENKPKEELGKCSEET